MSHHSKSGKPTLSLLSFLLCAALSLWSPVKQTSQQFISCGKGSNCESRPSVTCALRVQAPSKSCQCPLCMVSPHTLSLLLSPLFCVKNSHMAMVSHEEQRQERIKLNILGLPLPDSHFHPPGENPSQSNTSRPGEKSEMTPPESNASWTEWLNRRNGSNTLCNSSSQDFWQWWVLPNQDSGMILPSAQKIATICLWGKC